MARCTRSCALSASRRARRTSFSPACSFLRWPGASGSAQKADWVSSCRTCSKISSAVDKFLKGRRDLGRHRCGIYHGAVIAEERVGVHRLRLPRRRCAKGYSRQGQPINGLPAVRPCGVEHSQGVEFLPVAVSPLMLKNDRWKSGKSSFQPQTPGVTMVGMPRLASGSTNGA